ncbi:MAG: non-homologous end-joining DNA ligase [Candidatus Pacearchaeota archaeon]
MKISFMLCKNGNKEILNDKNFIFEPKLDGTRALVFIDKENKKLKIYNRREKEISYRYPEFKFWNNVNKTSILDGEIVVFDEKGLPNFNLLQQREQLDNKVEIKIKSKILPACFIAFDIISINNKDLRNLELEKRKKILDKVIKKEDLYFKKIIYFENGKYLWKFVKEKNLEGVIAKRKNSKYENKRSENWLKIKNYKTIDAIVIGFIKEKREISSLALALYKNNKLIYIGNVASGINDEKINFLLKNMKKVNRLKVKNLKLNKKINFIKPKIVVEVRYLDFKQKLRAPTLLRIRFDKAVKECGFDQLE